MSENKHVLQICHGYDGPFLDCARQYAQMFQHTPYDVTTVFLTGAPAEHVSTGCCSQQVIFLNKRSKDIRGLKLGTIKLIRQIATTQDFSLCIAHRYKSMYTACLGSNLPVIAVYHAFGDFQRKTRQLFAKTFHNRLHILAVSNAVRDDIRCCLPSWPRDKIETLYNRVDVEQLTAGQLERDKARNALQLPGDAWIVGNVGRLHPDKDQETLLRGFAKALPQLPERSLLVIIGTGKLRQHLGDLAQQLHLEDKVIFAGHVENARAYFKAFDLFVLTSDHEPFGLVLLEAMAARVPIVSTSCGGAGEVVGDTGILFPLRDSDALAQHIITISRLTPEQTRQLQTGMMQRLENSFSDTAVTEQFWQMAMTRTLLDK